MRELGLIVLQRRKEKQNIKAQILFMSMIIN